MKECTKCSQNKQLTDFHYRKNVRDRRASQCKLCTSIKMKNYWANNRQVRCEASRKSKKKNIANSRETERRRYKENPGKILAKNAKRRAAKLQATPKWADLEAIQRFYEECPPGFEVDHIVPLQGQEVRGLHVIYNLQYLVPSDNRKKNNKTNGITYSKRN